MEATTWINHDSEKQIKHKRMLFISVYCINHNKQISWKQQLELRLEGAERGNEELLLMGRVSV